MKGLAADGPLLVGVGCPGRRSFVLHQSPGPAENGAAWPFPSGPAGTDGNAGPAPPGPGQTSLPRPPASACSISSLATARCCSSWRIRRGPCPRSMRERTKKPAKRRSSIKPCSSHQSMTAPSAGCSPTLLRSLVSSSQAGVIPTRQQADSPLAQFGFGEWITHCQLRLPLLPPLAHHRAPAAGGARISCSISSAMAGFSRRKSQAFCLPWPILSPL